MKRSQLKAIVKEVIRESFIKKLSEARRIQDPTKQEMMEYLRKMYGKEEGFEDEAEVAIYWFANFNHGGQSSNLYSVLSTSPFNPGPIARGPEKDSFEEMMYQDLESEFGSGENHDVDEETDGRNTQDKDLKRGTNIPFGTVNVGEGTDIPSDMVKSITRMKVAKAEKAGNKPHKDTSKMELGELQRYYNSIEKFDDSVHVPGHGWGGVKEHSGKESTVECEKCHDKFDSLKYPKQCPKCGADSSWYNTIYEDGAAAAGGGASTTGAVAGYSTPNAFKKVRREGIHDERPCDCGSGQMSKWELDGNGIPLTRACPRCKQKKLAKYRPEILRPYNQSDVDEPIEPDESTIKEMSTTGGVAGYDTPFAFSKKNKDGSKRALDVTTKMGFKKVKSIAEETK